MWNKMFNQINADCQMQWDEKKKKSEHHAVQKWIPGQKKENYYWNTPHTGLYSSRIILTVLWDCR